MKTRVVAAVGVFDGVHRGHQAVLRRAVQGARESDALSVAFTFDPSPSSVIRGVDEAPRLTGLGEKVSLLREEGVTAVRVLRFTQDLAHLSPAGFLERHLLRYYDLQILVVGHDFALGHERKGTPDFLRSVGDGRGFAVEPVPAVEVDEGVVSSTRIRNALGEGRVHEANRLLGRCFSLAGVVGTGEGRGKDLGFPTANLAVPKGKMRPARGVYVVWVDGVDPTPRLGMVNVGLRPTFGEGGETVEAHILDFAGDLVDRRIDLRFVKRLRSEIKFKSINELRGQIERDAVEARQVGETGR